VPCFTKGWESILKALYINQNWKIDLIIIEYELRDNKFYYKNSSSITSYVFFYSFATQQKTSSSLSLMAHLWQILIFTIPTFRLSNERKHTIHGLQAFEEENSNQSKESSQSLFDAVCSIIFVVQCLTLITSSKWWRPTSFHTFTVSKLS